MTFEESGRRGQSYWAGPWRQSENKFGTGGSIFRPGRVENLPQWWHPNFFIRHNRYCITVCIQHGYERLEYMAEDCCPHHSLFGRYDSDLGVFRRVCLYWKPTLENQGNTWKLKTETEQERKEAYLKKIRGLAK